MPDDEFIALADLLLKKVKNTVLILIIVTLFKDNFIFISVDGPIT